MFGVTMSNLKQFFNQSLHSIFPENANYDYEESSNKIRITYKIPEERRINYKSSQPICIHFDKCVVDEFRNAKTSKLNKLERSLKKFLQISLSNYDENGPHDSAFNIHVDDRILDSDF